MLCIIGAHQLSNKYHDLSNINSEQIDKWLSEQNNLKQIISLKKINVNLEKFTLYFTVDNLIIKPSQANLDKSYSQVTIEKLTGKINILEIILFGKIRLNDLLANHVNYRVNNLYANQEIETISGDIALNLDFFEKSNKNLIVAANLQTKHVNFNLDTILRIYDNKFALIKFNLQNSANDVREFVKYLPEKFINLKILTWLDKALLSGSIKHSNLLWEENKNFSWKIKFNKVKLLYNTNWPTIDNFSPILEIADNKLRIYTESKSASGTILQNDIKSVNATLNDIYLDTEDLMSIKLSLSTSLPKGINFLKKINLYNQEFVTDKISTSGNILADVHFSVPLNNNQNKIKFIAKVGLNKANLHFTKNNFQISNITGDINADNGKIYSNNLKFKMLDKNINIAFSIQEKLLSIQSELFSAKIPVDTIDQNFNMILSELKLFDKTINNIKITNDLDANIISFVSEDLKGFLDYKDIKFKYYKINFDALKINQDSSKISTADINAWLNFDGKINININDLYINDNHFGKLNTEFTVDFRLQDSKRNQKNIFFKVVEITDQEININADGKLIIYYSDTNNTDILKYYIKGKLNSTDFEKTLKKFNINHKFIQSSSGEITFDLTCGKDLLKFSLADFTGKVNLNISSGVIKGVDPGLGRLVSLLSFESIRRRLQLDFTDLTAKGFAFDTLQGDVSTDNGGVEFDRVTINGTMANLVISGSTILGDQQLDLTVDVTSKVGATLPLAAAIAAGNPMVGAALWLFDHASGSKVSELKTQKYHVTGNWQQPNIAPM